MYVLINGGLISACLPVCLPVCLSDLSTPRVSCVRRVSNSSRNCRPKEDSPPQPLPLGSPAAAVTVTIMSITAQRLNYPSLLPITLH